MYATRLHHKAATLHSLLLVGVVALSTTSAGAQTMTPFQPSCNFQEVSLAPCMAGACAGGGNISGACCSSLNRALDAGHRCVCSLLLANPVVASLVTNLLTLPLVLPLPECFLYAPSLAACQSQATVIQQQTNNAPPTAGATPAVARTGGAAPMADPPTTTRATTLTPSQENNKSAGPEKADGGRVNATTAAAGDAASRSDACRRDQGNAAAQGTAYALTFLTAVAVSWISCMTVS